MRKHAWLLGLLALTASCEKTSAAPVPSGRTDAAAAEPSADAEGLGEVMLQVGRRFETAGRAAAANRFELAAFEAGELQELFENDVPRASLPKEGPTAQIPGLAKAFLATAPPELDVCRGGEGRRRVRRCVPAGCGAVQRLSRVPAEKAFIQVPAVPGQSVPILDPLPAPTPGR